MIIVMTRLETVAPTSKHPDQENTNSDFETPHGNKKKKNNKMVNMI